MEKPSDYTVDQPVYVHAFGHWYEGKVVKIGRKLVHAEYTSGTGATRIKKCNMEQISTEKIEGERAVAGRQKSKRSAVEQEKWDKAYADGRVQVRLQIEWKHHLDPVRCLAAFQALQWPPGFFKVTHTRAREVIEECIGMKLKKRAKPERSNEIRSLEDYIEWASLPENSEPLDIDDLPPGTHLLSIIPEEEQAVS